MYIGVNDRYTDLFEGLYKIPEVVSFNSYIIKDQKIAVCDSVEADFGEEWLKNIDKALCGRHPDYLIIHHMEPDHSANIENFLKVYPDACIVGNAKTFTMIKEYFSFEIKNCLTVAEGAALN
ncbi:MAG: flavodoxin, partial [Clostridia bacterium]|nr:flavodoxin [Clostridia bacterium]